MIDFAVPLSTRLNWMLRALVVGAFATEVCFLDCSDLSGRSPTLVFISAAYAQDVSNVEVKATHRLSSKRAGSSSSLDDQENTRL